MSKFLSKAKFDILILNFLLVYFLYHLSSLFFFYFDFSIHNELFNLLFALIAYILLYKVIKYQDIRYINIKSFFFIIFLSIFLKFNPYPWVGGGQDQGVYVNMHKAYENKIFNVFKDKNFDFLKNEDLKDYYSIRQSEPGTYLWRKDEIYKKRTNRNKEKIIFKEKDLQGHLAFQFYPLTPLIYKSFAFYFGSENWRYSLTLFSILLNFIVFLIFREFLSEKKSLIGIFLLNLNPLINFFFKFPVSETFTILFFTLNLYIFLKIVQNPQKKINNFFLLLYLVNCICIFFIRIDSIFYLLNFLIFFSYIKINKKFKFNLRENLFLIWLPIFFFLLSIFIHLRVNEHYTHGMFKFHFGKLNNYDYIILYFIIIFISYFITELLLIKSKLFNYVIILFQNKLNFFLIIIFVFSLIKIYFSDISSDFFEVFKQSKILKLFFFLNLYFIFIIFKKEQNFFLKYLQIIFLFWLIWHGIIDSTNNYNFYYSRYIFSNIFIIFSIFLFINFLSNTKFNFKLVFLASIVFFIYGIYSVKQTTNTEYLSAYKELKNLSESYGGDDNLIVIYNEDKKNYFRGSYFINRIKLPLKFYFNNYVIAISKKNWNLLESSSLERFKDIYILSEIKIDQLNSILIEKRYFSETFLEHTLNRIPLNYKENNIEYYVYKYR